MFGVNRITIKGFAVVFMLLAGMLITNEVLFVHVHKLADGSIITHSHPFNKSDDSEPYKNHHHSQLELLFISTLDYFFPLVFLSINFLEVKGSITRAFSVVNIYISPREFARQDRAPPFFTSFVR
ncbi:MAG: hypothetical protein ACOC3S_00790 [Bacteroidota bacterium]